MPDNDEPAADIREHPGRHLAGMGAGLFGADILRAQQDRLAAQALAHVGQVDERRADDDFCRAAAGIHRDQFVHEAAGLRAAAVHLPVACDEGTPHVRSPRLPH